MKWTKEKQNNMMIELEIMYAESKKSKTEFIPWTTPWNRHKTLYGFLDDLHNAYNSMGLRIEYINE